MRNFYIQSLALAMMMATVYGAPVTCNVKAHEVQLQKICSEAQSMINHTNLSITVQKVSFEKTKCVKHFFCLAEKALKAVDLPQRITHSVLVRHLAMYNKAKNDTTCELATNSKYYLKTLLEEIKECAEKE